jgi:hypothetical protein
MATAADLLAKAQGLASSSAAGNLPAAGKAGKGGGKGFDEWQKSVNIALLSHERAINTLEDRMSFVFFLKTPEVRAEVLTLRTTWRTEDKARNEKQKVATASGVAAQLPDHSLGAQRVLMFTKFLDLYLKVVPADSENHKTVSDMISTNTDAIASSIFRLKPAKDEPKEPWMWCWNLMLSENPEADPLRVQLTKLSKIRLDTIGVAPSRQQEGPAVRSICGLKGKGRGKGGGKGGGQGEDSNMADVQNSY